MKLYADYIKEREGKECHYNEHSFITYKIYGKEASLLDIYTDPSVRHSTKTYHFVMRFLENLKEKGIDTVYGYTDETTNGWEKSDVLMIKFGFTKLGKIEKDYNNYVLNLTEIL